MFDTYGRELTPEQEEFFKNSKIKDNGKLCVCWHGTGANIDVFDTLRRICYFSAVKSYANEYAKDMDEPKTYEVYLNIERPLGKITRGMSDRLLTNYRKYCEDKNPDIDPDWVIPHIESNIGSYISTLAIDNDEDPDKTFYKYLKSEKEWDGIIVDEGYAKAATYRDKYSSFSGNVSFIPFYSNQVKAVSNKNPSGSNNINEALEMQSNLNTKLFDDDCLKEDVRDALYNIANTFIEDVKQNNIPIEVVDIWLVGSNASYNYSDHSDIDLHIIVDTDNLDCTGLLNIVYNYVKSDFNKNHDITVKGIPVEVYIEDQNASAITNGIYSIVEDTWIKYPEKIENIPEFNPEESEAYSNVKEWVLTALQSGDLNDVQDAINRLYLLRKSSLATDGEFGEGNLIFKEFRNDGSLDKLKERKRELVDKELTLEQLKEEKKMNKRNRLLIMPGDPAKSIAAFNANMGNIGEKLNESGSETKRYDVDKKHVIYVNFDKDVVEIEYNDLYYARWYESSPASYWEPADYDYDEIEIAYTYRTDVGDFLYELWETLSMEDYEKAEAYDKKVGKEDAWLKANMDSLMQKYGSKLVEKFREQAEESAADEVDPEDTYPDPPDYDD